MEQLQYKPNFISYIDPSLADRNSHRQMTEQWKKQVEKKGLESAGKLIGFSERIIIFSLILVNQYTALGLIVATKSIFRLREGSNEAEYYLVGSMLSFSAAIIVGLVVKQLIIN